jgi:hypothetical protein
VTKKMIGHPYYWMKRGIHRVSNRRMIPSQYFCTICDVHVIEPAHTRKHPDHHVHVIKLGLKFKKAKPTQYQWRQMTGARLRTIPRKVSFRAALIAGGWRIFQQGQQGSCTANAGCTSLAWIAIKWNVYSGVFSRAFLYYMCRLLRGWQNEDSGAMMEDIGTVLAESGCCLNKTMPYDQFNYTRPPSVAAKKEALDWRINPNQTRVHVSQIHEVTTTAGPENPAQGLVLIGIPIYRSYLKAATNGGWVPLETPGEELLGYHAIAVTDSDLDLKGPTGLIGYHSVANSWGEMEGDKGFDNIPIAFMMQQGDSKTDNWTWIDTSAGPPGPLPKTCAEKYPNDWVRMILCYLGFLKTTKTQRAKVQKVFDQWKAGKF